MSEDITPIRQQYLDIKKKYPDTIVFFRLGDFYETFDQDAETTSKELDIVLTGRNVAKGMRIPMAGIPYHAVDNYLSKLIEHGYHVAICEQVGEQPAKGIFPREVVRVVTPGTVTEPTLLSSNRNNYLLSYFIQENTAGIAYADISTGEFYTTEIHSEDILASLGTEINRISPSEILLSDQIAEIPGYAGHVTHYPNWHFEPGRCHQILLSHFNVATLEGFGLKNMPLAERSAGVIIQYLQDTQSAAAKQLTAIHTYSQDEFMILDASTRRNLELTSTLRSGSRDGSLLGVLDQANTPMGHRLLASWINKPLLNIQQINHRLDGVEYFSKDGLVRSEFRKSLRSIVDIERITSRIMIGNASPRELISLRESLITLPLLTPIINQLREAYPEFLPLDDCVSIKELIDQALLDEPPATLQGIGIIKPEYSTELDQVIDASKHAREWIASLETVEKNRTGIKTLKVGFNKVFGYYLEITHANSDQAPPNYIRKQTLVNAERYITPELKEYESLVLNAEARTHEIEIRLFKSLLVEISKQSTRLLMASRVIAELDVLSALAEVAIHQNYHRPEIKGTNEVDIRDGRHPVVEQALSTEGYIPNDFVIETGEIVRVITGPNMSGKSTYLRQVALIVLMAQMGSFVPASTAKIGLVDRIFTRIGAQDEIHSGQSTFMVEMVETANILHHATMRSLLILDEIGRGTSTYDGLSIAWAVIEYIHNHPQLRARTLFATHYHELILLPETFPGIRNYNVAVTETDGKVLFLHKIIPGGADRSYGIHVAQIAGIPGTIIQRANQILIDLESSSGHQYKINPISSQQIALFPETNPLLDEIKSLDINQISPIEALNKLYEWKKKYIRKNN
jgi:DNA mismatch repair protein MutS